MVALVASSCFPLPVEVPSAPRTVRVHELEGTWHVVSTNFPMWLDGTKRDPRFTYGLLPDSNEGARLSDEVSYQDVETGARETIEGIDTQDPSVPAHFTWRGDGILMLFTSEWYVAAIAPDRSWAIIYFTETPATPEGVDIIARTPWLPPAAKQSALDVLRSDPFLREKARGLVHLPARAWPGNTEQRR